MRRKKKRIRPIVKYMGMCVVVVGFIIGGITFFEYNEEHKAAETPIDDHPIVEQEEPFDVTRNLDVMAIGNSDLYSAFNPLQLWNEQGITSFVGAAPKQNMKLSYYILLQCLKVKKPKVLLLEVSNFFDTRDDAVEKQGYEYTALKYCYPIFKDDSSWEEISHTDFENTDYVNARLKNQGYAYSTELEPYYNGFSYMNRDNYKKSDLKYTNTYLRKIMNSANENNIKVLFVCFPSATTWSQKRHDKIVEYANEYNVDFIDFNTEPYNEYMNFKTDTRDGGNHLNYSGAKKMTNVLGLYLIENYALTSHKDDKHFDDWNKEYDQFEKMMNDQK